MTRAWNRKADITGEQLRAARSLLRMEQAELARRAGISVETVKRLEVQRGPLRAKVMTILSLVGVLEMSGIKFLREEDGSRGVRAADMKHRAAINNEIVASLIGEAALEHDHAVAVVTAIAQGKVPHTRIAY